MLDVFHGVGIINSLVALIPGALIFYFVFKQDKKEKEPIWLLLLLVVFGAISTFIAGKVDTVLINDVLAAVLSPHSMLFQIICYFVIVATVEEGLKYFAMRLTTWKSKHFNYRFDGVVYGACVGLGFGLYETFGMAGQSAFNIMLIKSLTGIPGHVSYGIIMGLLYGYAKALDIGGKKRLSLFFRVLAFAIPWAIHGTYDFIASLTDYGITSMGAVYLMVLITIIVAAILLKVCSVKDKEI